MRAISNRSCPTPELFRVRASPLLLVVRNDEEEEEGAEDETWHWRARDETCCAFILSCVACGRLFFISRARVSFVTFEVFCVDNNLNIKHKELS